MMKFFSYKKVDTSDPALPSKHVERFLTVGPVKIEYSRAWGWWQKSFGVEVGPLHLGIALYTGGGRQIWLSRTKKSLCLYIAWGYALSVGVSYDPLWRMLRKVFREGKDSLSTKDWRKLKELFDG